MPDILLRPKIRTKVQRIVSKLPPEVDALRVPSARIEMLSAYAALFNTIAAKAGESQPRAPIRRSNVTLPQSTAKRRSG
jgi:hypothetical protein